MFHPSGKRRFFFVDFLGLGQHRVAVSNGNVFEWVTCCLKSCLLHLFFGMEMCSTGVSTLYLGYTDIPQYQSQPGLLILLQLISTQSFHAEKAVK